MMAIKLRFILTICSYIEPMDSKNIMEQQWAVIGLNIISVSIYYFMV